MATNIKTKAMCDICGFVYNHNVMRLNSYGLLVCPEDFEGQYDLKNSPLNKVPNVRDNPRVRNPRPDTGGRGITWDEYAEWLTTSGDTASGELLVTVIGNTNWNKADKTWAVI